MRYSLSMSSLYVPCISILSIEMWEKFIRDKKNFSCILSSVFYCFIMFIEKELYKNILESMPIPTVDIIFLNSHNELLLCKRNNEPLLGVYYIPWGRVNKGETLTEAAKRKAKEELIIDIDISRLRFIEATYNDIFDNSAFENISTHCIPITYIYELNSHEESQFTLWDSQHSDLRFFSLDDPNLHAIVKLRVNDLKKII